MEDNGALTSPRFSNGLVCHCEVGINCNFRLGKKIEFRDASNLSTILHTHIEVQHNLTEMCAAPSALLYEDESKTPREVHWWDLSHAQLKPATGKSVIHTRQFRICNMCFVVEGDKQLLIVAGGRKGLLAYNIESDKLEWKFDGHLSGPGETISVLDVSTDARGHLFVADGVNDGIQMFSVTDGQYLGCLTKDLKHLGKPNSVHWCEKTSSVVCTCYVTHKFHLKLLSIQYRSTATNKC